MLSTPNISSTNRSEFPHQLSIPPNPKASQMVGASSCVLDFCFGFENSRASIDEVIKNQRFNLFIGKS